MRWHWPWHKPTVEEAIEVVHEEAFDTVKVVRLERLILVMRQRINALKAEIVALKAYISKIDRRKK